jgi:hypothetical protein
MASVRLLKKDIHFLSSELITQVYLNQVIFKDTNEEVIGKSIADVLDFRASFIARANYADGKNNSKLVKSYFSKLRKDMIAKFDELVQDVSKIENDKQ